MIDYSDNFDFNYDFLTNMHTATATEFKKLHLRWTTPKNCFGKRMRDRSLPPKPRWSSSCSSPRSTDRIHRRGIRVRDRHHLCRDPRGLEPICERLLTGRDKEGAQKDPRLLKFAETIYNRLASN